MPLLKITTNQTIEQDEQSDLLKQASATVAEMLGKPESYVMVELVSNPHMLFSGTSAALAYLEFKSIGLPIERTGEFSETLCHLIEQRLHIPTDRIYIEFSAVERQLWGWNSGTF